ncbi:ABC transporter ATP-binding protein [Jannaschia sp. Os4]|uniref:ABC transporter ATP-binding protein n=1 Tax=Jannaschia sp. Os4 TaxID=2807617 RepID=UPI001939C35D|nr:ABC transporter ATP-binding protein [Jannaschia sp. Os4]MBM2577370.1 ABC transporter ATP-binding protein [Jannaschia sp. Os4]
MSQPIALRNVTHAYRTDAGPLPVLDDLSIEMPEGSFTAVVGPSGCGKSTLTRLVAGLMKPDEGTVLLGGDPVKGPRKTVGMAFQNPVLLEWRTILDNVILPLEIVGGMSRTQREARARELLALVGLEGYEHNRPSELSGGMRQRASLCRSIVHRPEVLILDEPFGALDAFTREDLWQTMRDLRQVERFTTVLITHDLRESVFLGDRVVVFSARPARAQRVVEVDLPEDRDLESLYTPRATELLAVLRREIQIAQGREVEAAAPARAGEPFTPAPGAAEPPVEDPAASASDPSVEAPR